MMDHFSVLFTAVYIPWYDAFNSLHRFIINIISKAVNVKPVVKFNKINMLLLVHGPFQAILFSLFLSTTRAVLTVFTVTTLWFEKWLHNSHINLMYEYLSLFFTYFILVALYAYIRLWDTCNKEMFVDYFIDIC